MLGNFLLINLDIFTHLIKQKEHIPSFFLKKLHYNLRESQASHSQVLPAYTVFRNLCPMRFSPLSRVRLFATSWTVSPRLLCPWDSPGKSTGVGCCALFQGIFPNQGIFLTQGSNPHLTSTALAGGSFTTFTTWDAQKCCVHLIFRNLQLHINCKLILTYSKLIVRQTESLFKIPE